MRKIKIALCSLFTCIIMIVSLTVSYSDGVYGQTVSSSNYFNLYYRTHVQDIGWLKNISSGGISGTTGRSLRLEALTLFVDSNLQGDVLCKAHVQDVGWQDYVGSGVTAGTTGRSLRLEAVSIILTDELADNYDIYYRVHIQDYGWLNWTKNGGYAGSAGLSKRLEAIEIRLYSKSDRISFIGGNAYIDGNKSSAGYIEDKDSIRSNSINYINDIRQAYGKTTLSLDNNLCDIADTRARELVGSMNAKHIRPDGRQWYTILNDYSIGYICAGENIASGFNSYDDAIDGFMSSKGHKENILCDSYSRVGLGHYYDTQSQTHYWVEIFIR